MRLPLLMTFVLSVPLLAEIGPASFAHHFIAREMPGRAVGIGSSALADFDKDGDLDFAVYNRGDGKMYWFEQRGKDDWAQHLVGEFRMSQLGAAAVDVDHDGWIDLVIGGYWFRNPGRPRTAPFERYTYDSRITREIHDVVLADMDGDGRLDVAAMGDGDGCFWYSMPDQPAQDADWPRTTITLSVKDDQDDIHAGIYPGGIGDLDNDGDADVVLPDRWLENSEKGTKWVRHGLPFGRKGPWGLSARSWIIDLDGDGFKDIVMVDGDGQNSGLAWLRNNGRKPAGFSASYQANRVPGTRGSFHSLRVADFDGDGDGDILVVEQEDPSILPLGATPRWFIYENLTTAGNVRFEERVILDERLGGHDAWIGDIDGDGDIDIAAKIWSVWSGNSNGGRVHVDWMENLSRRAQPAR
ncbi:FG-GAP repeat domain-containing protein [Paludibaculum fermentans]|uniref:FG-GAP repeat domain-containing protein n=1 Tax=Paludibaculum fermentans TaxID=1473598 RepID=UPI003EBE3776